MKKSLFYGLFLLLVAASVRAEDEKVDAVGIDVSEGDVISLLIVKVHGSPRFANDELLFTWIAEMNDISNIHLIRPGQKIGIPTLKGWVTYLKLGAVERSPKYQAKVKENETLVKVIKSKDDEIAKLASQLKANTVLSQTASADFSEAGFPWFRFILFGFFVAFATFVITKRSVENRMKKNFVDRQAYNDLEEQAERLRVQNEMLSDTNRVLDKENELYHTVKAFVDKMRESGKSQAAVFYELINKVSEYSFKSVMEELCYSFMREFDIIQIVSVPSIDGVEWKNHLEEQRENVANFVNRHERRDDILAAMKEEVWREYLLSITYSRPNGTLCVPGEVFSSARFELFQKEIEVST